MKRQNKKGFTIVELVIVISVIAILSAVLIPVFSGIVDKANRSADEQALRQMNVVLATEEVDDDVTVFDVFDSLADAGLDAKDYKALAKGMAFFWDSEINRVLYVDTTTGTSVLPAEYKDRTNKGKWQSLTQKIEEIKPSDSNYSADGKTVTVNSGNQLAYVLGEEVKGGSVNNIKLSSDVDMMGAAFDLNLGKEGLTKDLTIAGQGNNQVTIKNTTSVNAKTTFTGGKEGQDGFYNTALVAKVATGKTLTIENVVIENLNIKDSNASNCALLVAELSGNLVLKNVTIKNCSIIGHHNVGILVGNIGGSAKITVENVTIENVTVQTVGGRVGSLLGYMGGTTATFEGASQITMSNVTTGIYTCSANVGTYKGSVLGLKDNMITSTENESDGTVGCKARVYFEDSLVGNISISLNKYEKSVDGVYTIQDLPNANKTAYNNLKALVR